MVRKIDKRTQRKYDVRRLYNLALCEADAILSRGCEICGSLDNLCIDHDHDTNTVRGCLCRQCNIKLGHYEAAIKSGLADKFKLYLEDKQNG